MGILNEKINGDEISVNIISTNIKSATYNTTKKELMIEFKNNTKYIYSDVPHEIFVKFRMADSQGKYFSININKKYTHNKVII